MVERKKFWRVSVLIIAYQIMDMNNPVSVYYSNISKKSFEPVKDLVHIVPFQCTVPSTLPKNIKWRRCPTEEYRSIVYTYYRLMQKVMQGEEFIILEHDAYLIPERENIFRFLYKNLSDYLMWNPGAALECSKYTKPIAEYWIDSFENQFREGVRETIGAMGLFWWAAKDLNLNLPILWPWHAARGKTIKSTTSRDNERKFWISKDWKPSEIYEIYSSPITQVISKSRGVTNRRRENLTLENSAPKKETHPTLHFID